MWYYYVVYYLFITNNLIQINTCIAVLFLVFIANGFYNASFVFVRWYVFISALLVAYPLWKSRDKVWLAISLTVAIVFNPIFPLFFIKSIWQVIDLITATIFSSFLYYYYDYYKKGIKFENYISELFPDDIWVILDRTKDFSKKLNRFVESDTNPDFTFRHIKTGKTVAVECKYHSYFYQGKYGDNGIWWKKAQGTRYEIYGKRNSIPVFVAIGIAGNPSNPQRIFLCPLEKLNNRKYDFVPESELRRYEKKVGRELMLESF